MGLLNQRFFGDLKDSCKLFKWPIIRCCFKNSLLQSQFGEGTIGTYFVRLQIGDNVFGDWLSPTP